MQLYSVSTIVRILWTWGLGDPILHSNETHWALAPLAKIYSMFRPRVLSRVSLLMDSGKSTGKSIKDFKMKNKNTTRLQQTLALDMKIYFSIHITAATSKH